MASRGSRNTAKPVSRLVKSLHGRYLIDKSSRPQNALRLFMIEKLSLNTESDRKMDV
jgi:hypothetical protein